MNTSQSLSISPPCPPDISAYGLTNDKYNSIKKRLADINGQEGSAVGCLVSLAIAVAVLIIANNVIDKSASTVVVITGIVSVIIFVFISSKENARAISKKKRDVFVDSGVDEVSYSSYDAAIGIYSAEMKQYKHDMAAIARNTWIVMDPREFEQAIGDELYSQGLSTVVTPCSSDGGVDVVVYGISEFGTIFIECKHLNKPVGVNVARKLFGVMVSENVTCGIIASIYGVTRPAADFMKTKNIFSLDLDSLIEMIISRANGITTPFLQWLHEQSVNNSLNNHGQTVSSFEFHKLQTRVMKTKRRRG